MERLYLDIVSPERSLFSGEVTKVRVPGTLGSFTILSGHAPIVSSLEKGVVSFQEQSGQAHSVEIGGGFVELSDNRVTLCVEEQAKP